MKTITFDDTVWKLVPITPTREMLTATLDMGNTSYDNHQYILTEHWKDMLAAAPTQEHAPSQSFDEVWDSIDWNEWRMISIRDLVQMIHSKTTAVPAEIDVRTILLDIAPGDGNGQEVYARTVDDVVNKLTEMAERLDAAEAPAPAPSKGAVGFGAQALAAELAEAALKDDNDPEGHDISAGLFGPNVSAWLRKVASEYLAAPAPAQEATQSFTVPDDLPGMWEHSDLTGGETDCAKPAQDVGLTDEMVTAGGRALCKINSRMCGVNDDDNWATYHTGYKADAKACLIAALRAKGDK